MRKRVWLCAAVAYFAAVSSAAADEAKLQRIGVIYVGGSYEAVLQGMRAGLKDAGLVEGKQLVLHIRNLKGSLRETEDTARQLESERIDLLFTITTSVTTAAQKATQRVPIVFYAGNDPVRVGLVKSFPSPGGRLTGVHHLSAELFPKRLQILHQALPKARRVITFYDPESRTARDAIALGRAVASKLGIEIIERPIASVDEFLASVRALRAGQADAYITASDPMTASAMADMLPFARERKLPVVVNILSQVEAGALLGYGADYFDIGRIAAKQVRQILGGARPQDIPVEIYDKVQLAVNLRVAKELGVTVPEPLMLRADQVIR